MTQVVAMEMNQKYDNDILSQYSFTKYSENRARSQSGVGLSSSLLDDTQNEGFYEEDDDDVLHNEFLKQYPLPNTKICAELEKTSRLIT